MFRGRNRDQGPKARGPEIRRAAEAIASRIRNQRLSGG